MCFSLLRYRRIIGGLSAGLLVLLSGCSAVQFTYGQGTTLAYWWLDRYADFTPEQAPRVKAALADWFAWHRRSQLGGYADELTRLQQLVRADVTPQQLCAVYAGWQYRLTLALDQAVPATAQLALTLGPAQLAHIQQRQATQLEEAAADYMQPDAEQRLAAAVTRQTERWERLYGRLDAPQRQVLRDVLAEAPTDPQRWLAQRRQQHQAFNGLLRSWLAQPPAPAAAEAALRSLLRASAEPADPERLAERQRSIQAGCGLAARLHNSTTPAQRSAAAAQFASWAADLRALAGTAVGAASSARAVSGAAPG